MRPSASLSLFGLCLLSFMSCCDDNLIKVLHLLTIRFHISPLHLFSRIFPFGIYNYNAHRRRLSRQKPAISLDSVSYHGYWHDSSCSLPRLACSLFMSAMNLLLSLVPGWKDGACPDTCVELLHCNVRIWNNTIIQCFLKPKIAVLCITL